MLAIKDIIKILNSYNINSSAYGPSIYQNNKEIGIALEIKDSTFGFLTRAFTFENTTDLENFLKKITWHQKNKKKWNIDVSLDNYEVKNPKIIYSYNEEVLEFEDMRNLENRTEEKKLEEIEDIEKSTALINIEGLTNYLINLKEKKTKIKEEKNQLKIKENELKYELLEALNIYYGKNKAIAKRSVNLEIINPKSDNESLQEELKIIKEKSSKEMFEYLDNLIKKVKEEELEEKYLINLYSNDVYNYNIDILNKQINFVKGKIEAEKNFNLKGSKIHNIDAELKSFLKTNKAPGNIKNFLSENINKIEEKYNKITDNKNSYSIISGTLVRMPIKKNITKKNQNPIEELNKQFDSLTEKKKAELIIYNSFYKEIFKIIKDNIHLPIETLKELININEKYSEIEEIAFNENNSHFLSHYFKYLDFKTIDTFMNSLINITKSIEETIFKIDNNLKVFCVEDKNNKEIISLNPIFNKKEKIYMSVLPANTNLLYIPDKINIDNETKEVNLISTKNIYLKSEIIDTSDSIIVNKYQKVNKKDAKNDIIITSELKLKETYIFNVGLIEGE